MPLIPPLPWSLKGLSDLHSVPPMRIADFDHRCEDRVPRLLVFEHGVGEHAAVPANVADASAVGVFEPGAGCLHDVELAVGVVGGAVAARFFMAAGAVDRAVVLSHMEV